MNVGSVGAYSIFDYDICDRHSRCARHLIQGGKELYGYALFLIWNLHERRVAK